MKEIIVTNIHSIEGLKRTIGSDEFTVKAVFPREEASKCTVNFVEVEPGNHAYSYHYHEMNEEVFYIISGTAVVRTPKGELALKAGDIITFPAGKEGAHVIRNSSKTEKLVYIDFGAINLPEIVHFPDTNKIMVVGPYSNGIYDEK